MTIYELEKRLKSLEKAFVDSQKRPVVVQPTNENKSFKVDKICYIDETEAVFSNVPKGAITVSIDDVNGTYLEVKSYERDGDKIVVKFDPLVDIATVTLIVQ